MRSSDRPKDVTSIHLWRWGSEVRALVGDSTGQRAVEHVTSLETWSRWRDGFAFHARAYAGLGKHAAQAAGAADALCEAVAAHVLPRLHVTSWERCVHVTSDPALADLPWELLLLGGCRLGRFHEILRTPLGSARPARAQRGEGAAVLGVGGPEIAAVHGEVARVAALLGTSRVSVGPSATRAALAKALSTASIVHVAGHGWDASEAPLLGGLRLADGWFAAEDLPSSISADLVVLGACRSGKAAGPAARAWGGFVARLLSGGARRVVWTSDDVEDRAAATFAEAYHRERTTSADGLAFGRALDRVATVSGHPGSVLPFRLSGVVS